MNVRAQLHGISGWLALACCASFVGAQTFEVPPFVIEPPVETQVWDVDVAAGNDGTIALLWVEIDGHNYQTGRAWTRHFSAAGVPTGPPYRTDTTEWANVDVLPTISADPRGGYATAWNILERRPEGGYDVELYGRFLDTNALPLATDFELPFEIGASIRFQANGDCLATAPNGTTIVWSTYDGFLKRLWAQHFASRDAEPDAPFLVTQNVEADDMLDVVAMHDGDVLVGWSGYDFPGGYASGARRYAPDGQPRGLAFSLQGVGWVANLAGSPFGELASISVNPFASGQILLRRYDADGAVILERAVAPTGGTNGDFRGGDIALDANGNALVAWGEAVGPSLRFRARAYDASGNAVGASLTLDAAGFYSVPHIAALSGGRFVVVWASASGAKAAVLSLCAPGAATCGDGVWVSTCEQCDDGAANSDTTPGACRTDCRRAGCADGIVDPGEGCDDGNRLSGDCCSILCEIEPDFDGDGICDPSDDCRLFPDPLQDGSAICAVEPYANLSEADAERFEDGLEDFAEIEVATSGLGPVFNGASCAECHHQPTIGGSSDRMVTRFGRAGLGGAFDDMAAFGGSLLQPQGITTGSCSQVGETVPPEATVVARRQSPALFGLGLVDAIADDRILKLADPTDRNNDGISGRAHLVGGRVGRFGWKADVATLREFAAGAYRDEMGITSPSFPSESAPQGGPATCDPVPDPEDDGAGVDAFTDFLTLVAPLPPLPLSADARLGRALFRRARCRGCHSDKLKTGVHALRVLHKRRVRLFSDLLLHDMGPELADGIGQGDASGSEFRTAPLWGVRASAPYLHDGRAATLEAAIALHGGEAAASRDAFLALDPASRARLVAYLNVL